MTDIFFKYPFTPFLSYFKVTECSGQYLEAYAANNFKSVVVAWVVFCFSRNVLPFQHCVSGENEVGQL